MNGVENENARWKHKNKMLNENMREIVRWHNDLVWLINCENCCYNYQYFFARAYLFIWCWEPALNSQCMKTVLAAVVAFAMRFVVRSIFANHFDESIAKLIIYALFSIKRKISCTWIWWAERPWFEKIRFWTRVHEHWAVECIALQLIDCQVEAQPWSIILYCLYMVWEGIHQTKHSLITREKRIGYVIVENMNETRQFVIHNTILSSFDGILSPRILFLSCKKIIRFPLISTFRFPK